MKTKHLAIAAAALVVSGSAAVAADINATYTDRASFLAAIGASVDFDFESSALSGTASSGAASSIDFGDFAVGSSPAAVKVLGVPAIGASNTTPGGANYMYLDTDIAFTGAVTTFTFDSTLTAFGFNYTSLAPGAGAATITVGSIVTIVPSGSSGFFGFTSDGFASFAFDSSDDSAVGFDDLAWAEAGAVSDVPAPAAAPLLLLGLGGLAALRRRG
ncbi:hypothetical protein ACQ5SO_09500 [Rhodovulum sp. DZ06]|uniref:hypothetical protein n=1 Tax=Rhodovulum sp. DZ06 TaxID=3425126 RepID=UPI003D33EAAB